MIEISIPEAPAEVEETLAALPNRQAVFLLWPREGAPLLARTNGLRKRLKRLLGAREAASKSLSLRGSISRLEYCLTGSRLESQFLLLELARRHLGAAYREAIRLRLPPWVKLVLTNPFPRIQVATHLGKAPAVYFGPFRNRSTAARFESEFLDLFQLRRCQEDLMPAPEHPGCIYGEMGRCLRPCQQAVGIEEYKGEAERVAAFLRTNGQSLLGPAASARERLSAEMDFEGAALLHQRCRKIEEVLAQRDEMARELEHLNAVAVLPCAAPEAVELGWLRGGCWQGFSRLEFAATEEKPVSLDARLRDLVQGTAARVTSGAPRMEELAVLSRWYYSSWRDGELLIVDDWAKMPYRKLVNAVSRVAQAQAQAPAPPPVETTAPEPPHPSTHS